MLAKFSVDPKSSCTMLRGMVQELYLEFGSRVATLGIGCNSLESFLSIFPTPVIGKMLSKFSAGGKRLLATLARSSILPASSVTWALAIGRFTWASCGRDPTFRLMATYPWADGQ